MKKLLIPLMTLLALGCNKPAEKVNTVNMPAPTDLVIEQLDSESARLTWKDNCSNEEGYYVFSSASNRPAATLPANTQTYTFEGLKMLGRYSFSVRAFGQGTDISPEARTQVITLYSADQRNYVDDDTPKVTPPSWVEGEQTGKTSFSIVWEDPVKDCQGYNVYLRDTSALAYKVVEKTVGKDVSSYEFTDLKTGTMYIAGVQSVGGSVGQNSKLRESKAFKVVDLSSAPKFTIESLTATQAGFRIQYKMENVSGKKPEHGVCLSPNHIPTVEDLVFPGPGDKNGVQMISSAALEEGIQYRIRLYVKVNKEYYYSSPTQQMSLPEAEAPITFNWTEVTDLELPESVKVYKTEDPLNGRNLRAWYAIASPSDVDFRVLYNPEKETVEAQAAAAEGCLVLINGGIFGTGPIGFAVMDGVKTPWRVADGQKVDCEQWGGGILHPVTRGLFGVDKDGVPGVGWGTATEAGKVSVYPRPIPTMAGLTAYPQASATFPCAPADWQPFNAITCGPVLLYDGRCPIDDTSWNDGENDFWNTNYELMADDIYGVTNYEGVTASGNPDRTAVGYTADGKVILFICDGRIADSRGATTLELSRIMKGLGCTGALNLDGGGSTGMWAAGGYLNYHGDENRKVMTTLGFFTKKD